MISVAPLLQGAAATQAPIPPLPAPPTVLLQDGFSPDGVPMTREAVRSMRGQRSELSDQLQSAAGRREELAQEMATASPAERPQMQARLNQLDERILSIETEIARTGALIARAPGQYLRNAGPDVSPFSNSGPPNMTAIGVIFTIFVLAPIAVSVARLVWRRASNPVRPAIDKEQGEVLRRLEGNVDAIALEIERISEGQRFVTKLLAERERARLES
jgi:hypothetical protein